MGDYERPYNEDEIFQQYGSKVRDKLMKDPVHKWRAKTEIELIHREPTYDEFRRIWG